MKIRYVYLAILLSLLLVGCQDKNYETNTEETEKVDESMNIPSKEEEEIASKGEDITIYGANGADNIDDTDAIQAAMDSNSKVYIPDGIYMINVNTALYPRDNQTITLSDNAILQAIPTNEGSYSLFNISDVSNVIISGGKLIGERDKHQGTHGEWGMGISIRSGASDIRVENIVIESFWGDGIYIGAEPLVTNVDIINVTCDNNRRQGLSITNAQNIVISNSIFRNTNGTKPSAGIDLEPNSGQKVDQVSIEHVQCYNNEGPGVDLMGYAELVSNVKVIDSVISDNEGPGIRIFNVEKLMTENLMIENNEYGIIVVRDIRHATFEDITISNSKNSGISINGKIRDYGVYDIDFNRAVISNNGQSSPGEYSGLEITNLEQTQNGSSITFRNSLFIDDQVIATQKYGVSIRNTQDIEGINIDSSNQLYGNIEGDSYNLE